MSVRSVSRYVLCAVVVLGFCCTAGQGAFISAEPDLYSVDTRIPDDIGVKLRNASYVPGHAEFDRGWRRIYAKEPNVLPFCGPSTGSLVLGNNYSHAFNGPNYGLRAWFVDMDNNWRPASYAGFDICWPADLTHAEGARVTAYGHNIDGNQVTLFDQVYKPSGAYTSVRLFAPGIKWLQVICWDDPNYHRQQYFSVDAFRFVSTPGAAFIVVRDNPLEAPLGMDIGPEESLSGDGSVLGDVRNAGVVSPGLSPGTLTIVGDYLQTAEGILEIELAGPGGDDSDLLEVTGRAALGGTLKVVLDGYQPDLGETFTVMTYAGYETAFLPLVVEGATAGLDFDIAYTDTAVILTAVPEPTVLALLGLAGMAGLRRRRR